MVRARLRTKLGAELLVRAFARPRRLVALVASGLITAMTGVTVGTRRANAPSQAVPRWSVAEIARVQDQAGVTDGALWRGGILTPRFRPPTLSMFDSTGRVVWTRAADPGFVAGIATVGDTVAILWRSGAAEEFELVRVLAATGREVDRLALSFQPGQSPRLLGWTGSAWTLSAISVFANRGRGLEGLTHAEFSLLDVDPRTGDITVRFAGTDSTTQVVPPPSFGRTPIRPPFAPILSFALLPEGAVAASLGDRLSISVVDAAGRVDRSLHLPPPSPQPVINRPAQVDVWMRSVNGPIRIDTLLQRIAASDTTTRGMSVGRIRSSPPGELLVQRRDMASRPLETVDSLVYDIVDARPGANPVVRGRILLDPRDAVLVFDGVRILCLRSARPAEPMLILYRLQRN